MFLKKDKLKDEGKIIEKDLGFIEDTWGFLMDMTAYEDHCINQFLFSDNEEELRDLEDMRKMRTYYLNLIGENLKGNDWCKGKHLCRIGKGLQEDCTRFLSMGDLEKAKRCANDYGKIYIKFIKLIGANVEKIETISSA